MFQLYRAIWRASAGRQIILIVLSIAIAGLAAVPLEFQRDIINHLTEDNVDTERLIYLGSGMMSVILLSLVLKWVLVTPGNLPLARMDSGRMTCTSGFPVVGCV